MRISGHKLLLDDDSPVTFMRADKDSGPTLKQDYIITHYTAGGSALSTANFFASTQAQASAHFVIGRDGSLIQQVECDTIAWHAGRSRWKNLVGLNSHSIGIELANWGMLQQGASGFKSHTGTDVHESLVVMGEHKNEPGRIRPWEMFTQAQFDAAATLSRALADEYDIGEENILGHDDIAPDRKIDPGPAFNMEIFRSRVFGRAQDANIENPVFRVTANNGLNLREGPGITFASLAILPHKTKVSVIENNGNWWLISRIVDGDDDQTGFVHSHWLERV